MWPIMSRYSSGMTARWVIGNAVSSIRGLRLACLVLLRAGCALAVEVCKRFPGVREPLQQRRWRPQSSVLLLELAYALVDRLQPNHVRVPHRAAAVRGEAVAVDINDVDVAGPKGDPFFQDARPLVDERIDGSLDDFLRADPAPRDPPLSGDVLGELRRVQVGLPRPTSCFVAIPPRAGLLAEVALFAQAVFDLKRLPPGRFQVSMLVANAPADIQSGQVQDRQRTHCHAKRL